MGAFLRWMADEAALYKRRREPDIAAFSRAKHAKHDIVLTARCQLHFSSLALVRPNSVRIRFPNLLIGGPDLCIRMSDTSPVPVMRAAPEEVGGSSFQDAHRRMTLEASCIMADLASWPRDCTRKY